MSAEAVTVSEATVPAGRCSGSAQVVSVRAAWKRARKVAIWALVTVSDGENVPAAVPRAIPRAATQPMPAACVESAATSSKNALAAAVEHSRPAASQVRATNVAICALVTGSNGENILSEVPRATPRADTQSMPAAWVEPEATSSKDEAPVDGHSRPAAFQVRATNVAICALVTGSDGENILSEVPEVIPSIATFSML